MTDHECLSKVLAMLLLRANERRVHRDYFGALECYLEAVERYGESAKLSAAIGHCYVQIAVGDPHETGEHYEQAAAWMRKAVELEPTDARLHVHLAELYQWGLVDYERATKEYRTAIELAPWYVKAYRSAATLYGVPEEVISLAETIGWLEEAVRLDPDDPMYHAWLGELYREAGRMSDAEREWRRALLCSRPLDPNSGYLHQIEEAMDIADT